MKPSRIAAVVEKEAKEILRDPVTVGIALVMPLIMLFLFGYAISLDIEDVRMGVLDHDRSPASRQLVDEFVQSGYFRLAGTYGTPHQMEGAMQRNAVTLAVVIPPGFQDALARGETAPVQVLVDGTYSARANLVAAYADTIISGFPEARSPAVRVEVRVWYNPSLESVNFIVPGLFGVILMAFPPLLTALAITREKETGSIQQIFASPLTPTEFLAGKLVPYGLIAFLQIVMVIAVGFLWFGVPLRGNLALFLGLTAVFLVSAIAIGVLIATISQTLQQALLLSFFGLFPIMFLSGTITPVESMPDVLQTLSLASPLRHYMEVILGIFLKGAGLPKLWPQALALVAIGTPLFVVAARIFGRGAR